MQVDMQGQLGGLGRGQVEAAEKGFIQDLSLGLRVLSWQQKRWPRTVPTQAEYLWSPSTGQSCRTMCTCSWLGNAVSGCSWTRAQPEPEASTRKWLRVHLTPFKKSFLDGDFTGTTRLAPSVCSIFRAAWIFPSEAAGIPSVTAQ